MKNKLTFSQEVVLCSIKKYYKEHLETPTLSEICEMVDLSAKSTVHAHLQNLKEKGYIDIEPKQKRGIIILDDK